MALTLLEASKHARSPEELAVVRELAEGGKRKHAHNGKDPGGDDPLIVCAYHYRPATGTFTRTTLVEDGEVGAGHYPVVTDIDGDEDLDIVLPGKSGLYLLRRRNIEEPTDRSPDTPAP